MDLDKKVWSASLLSFLPPSYIVAFIRELANKHFSNSSASISHYSMAQFPPSVAMNIDGDDNIRGRSTLSSNAGSRSLLISSSTLSRLYYECMEMNNNLLDVNI